MISIPTPESIAKSTEGGPPWGPLAEGPQNTKHAPEKVHSVLSQTDELESSIFYYIVYWTYCGSPEIKCPLSDTKYLMIYCVWK